MQILLKNWSYTKPTLPLVLREVRPKNLLPFWRFFASLRIDMQFCVRPVKKEHSRVGKLAFIIVMLVFVTPASHAQLKIAKLKYNGGGDWYANKTALPNLIKFCNNELGTSIAEEEDVVEVGSPALFDYPYVYMTGHGNVVFGTDEATNLRKYLIGGGFLHIDDNYGLDKFIRLELKKVFPELELIEIPFTHQVYHQKFDFISGLPKIHEHDGKPAQGFGLFYEGRLVVFYSYECDLGNGWEDQRIYNDPETKRQEALKMGANLIAYSFTAR